MACSTHCRSRNAKRSFLIARLANVLPRRHVCGGKKIRVNPVTSELSYTLRVAAACFANAVFNPSAWMLVREPTLFGTTDNREAKVSNQVAVRHPPRDSELSCP